MHHRWHDPPLIDGGAGVHTIADLAVRTSRALDPDGSPGEPSGTSLTPHVITCRQAQTLPGLFALRVERTPDAVAYIDYDSATGGWRKHSWRSISGRVARWRQGLVREGLRPGDRVAVALPNGIDWVCFDLAALSLGLVDVPLYLSDSSGSMAYILADSGARLLLLDSQATWCALTPHRDAFADLERVLCAAGPVTATADAGLLKSLADWLPDQGVAGSKPDIGADDLATIVYTSGTTGPPKGVMLSHRNLLWDAEAVARTVMPLPADVFLSFLPLTHCFERTLGYYLPMMAGASIAYARSIETLVEDLRVIRPTVMLAVPRVYERAHAAIRDRIGGSRLRRSLLDRTVAIGWKRYEARQGRAAPLSWWQRLQWRLLRPLVADRVLKRFGGRLRVAVCGGAPLSERVARFFLALGLPVVEGYGLTEAAPSVTGNSLVDNVTGSVGPPLPGIEVRLGPDDELLVRAPSVMLGYWRRPQETRAAIDPDGWLHTGDTAEIRDGRVYIRGRLKDILVMSTGEKAAPADLEAAIQLDALFDQVMVVGEGRPYLAALAVLNRAQWRKLAAQHGFAPDDPAPGANPAAVDVALRRVAAALSSFPSHAQVRAIRLLREPWTIGDGLLTPTMKVKRARVEARHAEDIAALYAGHERPDC